MVNKLLRLTMPRKIATAALISIFLLLAALLPYFATANFLVDPAKAESATGGKSQTFLRGSDSALRENLSLCGVWDFRYEGKSWIQMDVPRCWGWETGSFIFYEGLAWYRRNFTVPSEWNGKFIKLHFWAVNYRADVWLNDEYLGFHEGGYTPFWFDASPYLNYGSLNNITVIVDNFALESRVPDLAWGTQHGGIHREVFLEACDNLTVLGSKIDTEGLTGYSTVNANLSLYNRYPESKDFNVSVEVIDLQNDASVLNQSRAFSFSANETRGVKFNLTLYFPKLWSTETPNLYLLRAIISANGSPADEYESTFGVREVEVRPDGLYLNGEKLFVKGVNVREFCPEMGFTENDTIRQLDVELIKAANMNMIRLAHNPQHRHLLDLADREGLLVFDEIPAWQINKNNFSEKLASGKQQLREMILRDYNHPSVIIWSVGNELRTYDEAWVSELYAEAKALDKTRPVTQASDKHVTYVDPTFRYVDIICINEYYGGPWYGESPKDLVDCFERIRNEYPDKPILVTEYGAPGFEDPYNPLYLQTLKDHWLIISNDTRDYVVGGLLWVFDQYQGTWGGWDMSGIVDGYRNPLPAYYVIKELYSGRIPGTMTRIVVDGDPRDWFGQDIYTFFDESNDDKGDGDYTYPTNSVFKGGLFDLREFRVTYDNFCLYFLLKLGEVTNVWNNKDGFCHQRAVILIDQDRIYGSGNTSAFPNVNIDPACAWEYEVVIGPGGWGAINAKAFAQDGSSVSIINKGSIAYNAIEASVPISFMENPRNQTWRFIVLICSHEGTSGPFGGFRDVTYSGGEWVFGGGTDTDYDPLVLDLAFTSGTDQNSQLNSYNVTQGRYATISAHQNITFPQEIKFDLITLYKAHLNVNVSLHEGSNLVAKFYSYDYSYQAESIVWTGSTPTHLILSVNVSHPLNRPIENIILVLTDSNGRAISTVTSFMVLRPDLMRRLITMITEWPYASPEKRIAIFREIVDLSKQWPYAPQMILPIDL